MVGEGVGTGIGWAVRMAGTFVVPLVGTALVDGTRFAVAAVADSPAVDLMRALLAGCGAGCTAPS